MKLKFSETGKICIKITSHDYVCFTSKLASNMYTSVRIGIMKDGKLACVGSPLELKHQYDVGYELLVRQHQPAQMPASPSANPLRKTGSSPSSLSRTTASSSSTEGISATKKHASTLSEFVLKRLPGAVQYRAHPVPYELRFMLPLAARPDFGTFLGDLEASSADLHLENYGISMAPFEEVCVFIFCIFPSS